MTTCKLTIQINRPVTEVFQFTLDPNNTPLWVDSIVKEEVNMTPPRVGAIYRNVNKAGVWSEYLVTKYDENKLFEFVASDKNYHVQYTFTSLNSNSCELEYLEWVERGQLDEPFTIGVLQKLKQSMEK